VHAKRAGQLVLGVADQRLLLVLGASAFAGGLKYKEQKFNIHLAGQNASLMLLAVIALFVPALFLFILAVQLMKAGANAVGPQIEGRFPFANGISTLGAGWLGAYFVLSGSPVAATAISLFGADVLTKLQTFTMLSGSRLGASFIVLLTGFIYATRSKRGRVGSLGIGIQAMTMTALVYVPGMLIGYAIMRAGLLDGLTWHASSELEAVLSRLWGPIVDLIEGLVPGWALFPVGLVVILASFHLLDRVLPEVNGDALAAHRGVVANPNCTTMALVMALKPIHDTARIRRVVVASYQSVSGGGLDNMRALLDQTRALLEVPEALERGEADRIREAAGTAQPVAFNVRPQWKWQPDGDTEEEAKVVAETRKIMDADIAVSVTTMRVPVLVGHTLAVHLDLERPLDAAAARAALAAFPGVEVVDDPAADRVPTPLLAAGRDPVLVGRVRPDPFDPRALRLVVASDNLRKGAALNAIQIAEHLLAAGRLRPRRPAAWR
ncbi:MAG: aspartate-semialdehyde dehydrogenase, partial [Candidatus Rokubacteria bacterium]|nr:aspartate-semialdehyde dehydrogenase [Candidatus Rokubacteria bacterium]